MSAIKIIKCSNPKYWYNNLVGQTIDNIMKQGAYFTCLHNDDSFYINEEDAIELKRREKLEKLISKIKK
jgi:tRNA uridine 5-carbamoylmethylation protein Kti12